MTHLYFGPWCGEFGWEIAWAIPVLRKLAAEYDRTTICGPVGHRYLWDFADEYVEVETNGGTCYVEGELLDPAPQRPKNTIHLTPATLWKRFGRRERSWLNGKDGTPAPKSWRQYHAPAPPDAPDVLLALRGRKLPDDSMWKSWPHVYADDFASRLRAKGFTVAAIGGSDNHVPPGVQDLRGIPLEKLCGFMRAAQVVIGPSSGPMVLALLSGALRIVTWFAGPDDMRSRFETQWNPFNVSVGYVCSGRQPTPGEVMTEIEHFAVQ